MIESLRLKLLKIPHDWITLKSLKNTFISRAIVAVSIASFALSNFPIVPSISSWQWSAMSYFLGSILFLTFWVLVEFRIPIDFKNADSIDQSISSISNSHTFKSFNGRLGMLSAVYPILLNNRPIDLPVAFLQNAKLEMTHSVQASSSNWVNYSNSMYHAHLSLLNYDNHKIRYKALLLMLVGVSLMLFPIIVNVVRAFYVLLAYMARCVL